MVTYICGVGANLIGSTPPDSLAGLKGPTSKGGEERRGEGRERHYHKQKFATTPLPPYTLGGGREVIFCYYSTAHNNFATVHCA